MKTCVLCGDQVPKLAKSHVYPKALHCFFASPNDRVPPFVINRRAIYPDQVVQRNLGGFYGEFVCAVCERALFGPADNEFMRLHHQLSSWPPPEKQIELAVNLVPGNPNLLHRFALQTLWRWSACPRNGVEHTDAVGFGPVIERIRRWLLDPAGTLRTNHDVTVSYRIAEDEGLVLPPRGGWRAGVIVMTIGKFTFFVASRVRGLSGSLYAHRLQPEDGVRLLATTRIQEWIVNPMADMLGEGRMELADEFLEKMRARSLLSIK